jgi:trehalose/maltose hydrolase-like predicted phosphorylase
MSTPLSPPAVRSYRPDFLPAYVGNGVLGLRVPRIPLVGGLAIVNGFSGTDGETGAEGFARAPYPLAGDIELGGARLGYAPERAVLRQQRYDFECGELHTRFSFAGVTARADVEIVTFCSRSQPMLALQEMTVRTDAPCDVVLSVGVDPIGVPGRRVDRDTTTRGTTGRGTDGSLLWESNGGLATCGATYWSELEGAEADRTHDEDSTRPLSTRFAFRTRKGKAYRLRHIGCLVPDSMHSDPDRQAIRLLYAGQERGFDRLREENRRAWQDIWRSRLQLVGAPSRWQALADAAHFYLHTSAHASSPNSTSMFGLAYWPTYHYYRGHVMWDIETFVVPPLLLTSPPAARRLLEYRSERLEAARQNAAMSGYGGAQFPWESSPTKGEEAAPEEGAASAHEHHVSLDVALAFAQYLHATHDWEWGRKRAWPVMREVCEWLESRATRSDRGFEIRDVTGIAERSATVSNNAFVNLAAIRVLRETTALARPLGHEPRKTWQRIADGLVVPLDGRTNVIRNHDGYRPDEEKGETPEAAAALLLTGASFEPAVERATYEYYLGLADRYVGAPMLSALLGVFAARIGDRARALELFERGYADFVVDPFAVTLEYEPGAFPEQPRAAPFSANIGSFLTGCLYGLTGVRLSAKSPASWGELPVALPEGWDAIEVEELSARGDNVRLSAPQGAEHAELTEAGESPVARPPSRRRARTASNGAPTRSRRARTAR